MIEQEMLNKTISTLQESMDFPEALAFKIKPSPALAKRTAPDKIFLIQVGKGFKKEWNKLRNFEGGLIETKLQGKVFFAEIRRNAQPRFLRNAIFYLKEIREKFPKYNPLIVAPYVGPEGRALCRQEGVSYVDTLGNIGIFLKDGIIIKDSKRSIKRERRELKSLFSPKSTRVIRIILGNYKKRWLLQDLAATAKVSLGQTYNVIKKLIDEEYVEKTKEGVRLSNASALLEQWGSGYTITQANRIESFYSAENVYKKLIERLAGIAERENYSYAFTLFAGAGLLIPYVRTPHVHFYSLGNAEEFANKAGLKPVPSGGNVHLILPYDEGVLNPCQTIEGVRVVGNVQLYLDLLNYPARGKEQAQILREKVIGF
jgi:hypothetical protein